MCCLPLWAGGRGEPASGRRAAVLRSGRALLRAERSDHIPGAVPRRLELRIVPEPVAVEAVELAHELHDLIRDDHQLGGGADMIAPAFVGFLRGPIECI